MKECFLLIEKWYDYSNYDDYHTMSHVYDSVKELRERIEECKNDSRYRYEILISNSVNLEDLSE